MPKKGSTKFICSQCGAIAVSWSGKCNSCGEWNTLTEQLEVSTILAKSSGKKLKTQPVSVLLHGDQNKRISTEIADVDNVLGGGIVAGSIILIAGQPGIGKSTLLLQIAQNIAKKTKVLYVSGEESAHQIGIRASRIGSNQADLQLATSNSANDIAATLSSSDFDIVVVDSIQTIACAEISSPAGSVSQITNSTNLITVAAKQANTAVIVVGHVTKEGSIAGPKVLEHVVDVVLQLEGDRYGGFKILRSIKNRFGSTNEVGIFEMADRGLKTVANASAALLAERQHADGSVVLATMEGSRALLVEVQALVNKTTYGYPKRASSGFELNRLNLLIAMLERRTKLSLSEYDVYVNIVGGMKITEPAADLAVIMAVASAAKGMQLKSNAVVFGELGLSGELRHVPYIDKRIAEAKKLGFEAAIGPKVQSGKTPVFLQSVSTVREALNTYLET